LDEPVTWVHVSELMDAWRFLSGGELIVTTGLELAQAAPATREAYLRSLVEAGAQGLVLELAQRLREVPEEMLRSARLMHFPLVVFHDEVGFADLTKAANERILRPLPPEATGSFLDELLEAMEETGRSAAFIERQLGPVLALPARPRGTLLATLETLVRARFNIAEAARILGVRRQTVYYRIEQLTGMLGDLEVPYRRAGFAVALELLKRSRA
jgi:purine catabolism regulator